MRLPFILSSCNDKDLRVSFAAPDCVEAIIEDLQENDTNSACFASVKRYDFEGAEVFEIQSDVCLDGPLTIIDMDCDTICTIFLEGFTTSSGCGGSADFYSDAELIEVIFEEEN